MNHEPILSIEHILLPYKQEVERLISENLKLLGNKTRLYEACQYALLIGGKRFRPSLVLMIAKAIGKGSDVSQAALAVEYFHTASLIADDLPSMDNDDFRRNNPSAHKVFGESVALLASYALISEGYHCLARNGERLKESALPFAELSDRICVLSLENVSVNTGILGATGGQYLDLFMPDATLDTLLEIIHKKTVTLFEISFVLGWLFGGGEIAKLETVKKISHHFGMAFQIADDFSDLEQDSKQKATANLAIVLGIPKAKEMFHAEMQNLAASMRQLNLVIPEFQAMSESLYSQVPK